jgi:hypothetical protein
MKQAQSNFIALLHMVRKNPALWHFVWINCKNIKDEPEGRIRSSIAALLSEVPFTQWCMKRYIKKKKQIYLHKK